MRRLPGAAREWFDSRAQAGATQRARLALDGVGCACRMCARRMQGRAAAHAQRILRTTQQPAGGRWATAEQTCRRFDARRATRAYIQPRLRQKKNENAYTEDLVELTYVSSSALPVTSPGSALSRIQRRSRTPMVSACMHACMNAFMHAKVHVVVCMHER